MKTLYVCMDSINGIPHAIFEDEEIAKKFISKFKKFYITEIPLNLYAEVLNKDYISFTVIISKNGNTLKVVENNTYLFDKYSTISHGFNLDNNLVVHCFAKDVDHAIEIAKQKLAELKIGEIK